MCVEGYGELQQTSPLLHPLHERRDPLVQLGSHPVHLLGVTLARPVSKYTLRQGTKATRYTSSALHSPVLCQNTPSDRVQKPPGTPPRCYTRPSCVKIHPQTGYKNHPVHPLGVTLARPVSKYTLRQGTKATRYTSSALHSPVLCQNTPLDGVQKPPGTPPRRYTRPSCVKIHPQTGYKSHPVHLLGVTLARPVSKYTLRQGTKATRYTSSALHSPVLCQNTPSDRVQKPPGTPPRRYTRPSCVKIHP